MNIVEKAEVFATAAHAAVKQVRKYTGEPYINHPKAVRGILLKYAAWPVSEAMEAAALLHDTVEDTGIELQMIYDMFGTEVGDLVGLTDVSKFEHGNRRVRKQMDLEHTENSSLNAKAIKLADLIHNSESILTHDVDFAQVYVHEKERLMKVMSGADPGLYAEAMRVLLESKATLANLKNS